MHRLRVPERFDIFYPIGDVEENGKTVSKPLAYNLDI